MIHAVREIEISKWLISPTFNAADNKLVEKNSEKTPQNDYIHKSWFKSSPLLTFVVMHNWYILYIKLYHLMPFRKFTHVAAAYIWKHSLPRTVNQIFWIDAIKKYNLFSEILETFSDKNSSWDEYCTLIIVFICIRFT